MSISNNSFSHFIEEELDWGTFGIESSLVQTSIEEAIQIKNWDKVLTPGQSIVIEDMAKRFCLDAKTPIAFKVVSRMLSQAWYIFMSINGDHYEPA